MVPAVYVVFTREAADGLEVLLQLRHGTGYMDDHWAMAAAGHVEAGESVYDAARREAAEELGVTDLVVEPWCTMQRSGGNGQAIDERVDYFLRALSWTGTPRIMEPDKCAGLRWWALSTLPAPVVPHEERVLDTVRSGRSPAILTEGFRSADPPTG